MKKQGQQNLVLAMCAIIGLLAGVWFGLSSRSDNVPFLLLSTGCLASLLTFILVSLDDRRG